MVVERCGLDADLFGDLALSHASHPVLEYERGGDVEDALAGAGPVEVGRIGDGHGVTVPNER